MIKCSILLIRWGLVNGLLPLVVNCCQHGKWHVRVPWLHEFLLIFGGFLGVDAAMRAEEPVENFQDAKACMAKEIVPDVGPVCRLNGCVEEVLRKVSMRHSAWQHSFLPMRAR